MPATILIILSPDQCSLMLHLATNFLGGSICIPAMPKPKLRALLKQATKIWMTISTWYIYVHLGTWLAMVMRCWNCHKLPSWDLTSQWPLAALARSPDQWPQWPEAIALSWSRSWAKAASVRSMRWKSPVKVSSQQSDVSGWAVLRHPAPVSPGIRFTMGDRNVSGAFPPCSQCFSAGRFGPEATFPKGRYTLWFQPFWFFHPNSLLRKWALCLFRMSD